MAQKNPFISTIHNTSLSYAYALKNNFSFILKDTECVVINEQVFVSFNVDNVLNIKEFNSSLIEDLYLFQKEVTCPQTKKKVKSYSFK